MEFNDDDLKDFKLEAVELLEAAEKSLLALDAGSEFRANYDAIFRAFHSIKGAAGMLALGDLQSHMHHLEDILTSQQSQGAISKKHIDFFLRGSDAALKLLSGGAVQFDYALAPDAPAAVLAVAAVAPARAAPIAASPAVSPAVSQKGRIFVIDDEVEMVDVLSGILTAQGYEVRGVSTPQDALAQIADFDPQVILSDISMPGITGPELLKLIRRSLPDVPVVFVSGTVSKEILIGALPDEVFGVVEKPFQVHQIISVCERAIGTPRPVQLFGQAIKTLLGKFAELDDYFGARGREDERNAFQKEVMKLLGGLGDLRNKAKTKKSA